LPGYNVPDGCEANSSAVALAQRAGLDSPDGLVDLPDSDPVWAHAAHYLAGVCVSIILVASAEKIVLGGGVLNRKCLFPMIREQVQKTLNGYLDVDFITTDKINEYIVPAIHGNDAGIIGTLVLAETAVADLGPESPRPVSTLSVTAAAPVLVAQPTERSGSYVTSALIGVVTALAVHRMFPKL
jgi:hypothetical protein